MQVISSVGIMGTTLVACQIQSLEKHRWPASSLELHPIVLFNQVSHLCKLLCLLQAKSNSSSLGDPTASWDISLQRSSGLQNAHSQDKEVRLSRRSQCVRSTSRAPTSTVFSIALLLWPIFHWRTFSMVAHVPPAHQHDATICAMGLKHIESWTLQEKSGQEELKASRRDNHYMAEKSEAEEQDLAPQKSEGSPLYRPSKDAALSASRRDHDDDDDAGMRDGNNKLHSEADDADAAAVRRQRVAGRNTWLACKCRWCDAKQSITAHVRGYATVGRQESFYRRKTRELLMSS